VYGPHHQAVALHLPKSLGQHLLADAADQLAYAREAQFAMLGQHLQNQHGPLVRHAPDYVVDQPLNPRIGGDARLGRRNSRALNR